jgi:hypothetical protein
MCGLGCAHSASIKKYVTAGWGTAVTLFENEHSSGIHFHSFTFYEANTCVALPNAPGARTLLALSQQ